MGAPWSGGLIRQVISLKASRVEGSNPGRSIFLSYIFIRLNPFHVANDLQLSLNAMEA